jgi:signal transduction histidine kinase
MRMIRLVDQVVSASVVFLLLGLAAPLEASPARQTRTFELAEFVLSKESQPPDDSAAWKPVALPDEWRRRVDLPARGQGWYRIRFELAQVPANAQAIMINHRRSHNFALFVNGAYFGTALDFVSGVGGSIGNPIYWSIPPALLRAGENAVHIRMQATSAPVSMHGLGRILFGDARVVRGESLMKVARSSNAERAFITMGLVMGVVALVLWYARRNDRVMFWFSVTCLLWGFAGLLKAALRWSDLSLVNTLMPMAVRYGLVVPSIILCMRTVGLRSPRVEAGLWAFFIVELTYPIWSSPGIRVTTLAWDLMNVALLLSAIVITLYAGKRPLRWLHGIALAALSLMAMFIFFEVARYLGWVDVESPVYRHFHVPVMLIAFGAAVFERHVAAMSSVERINAELERRVEEKAREIEMNHSRVEEAMREQALARERNRILADMHDGLGASLVGLLRYVQSTRPDAHIEQRVKEALQELRISIDALEPSAGDLGAVLGNLRYRLEPLLEPAGVHLEWEVAELPQIEALEPAAVFALQRIVLEAVANALKHSGASRVRLSAQAAPGGGVEIRVEDDGRGFDPSHSSTGTGLRNMRARAARIGVRLEISSRTGGGTAISLLIPRRLPDVTEDQASGKPDPRVLRDLAPATGLA